MQFMLRIRFTRTGKVGQPSFRIVVAEHRAPVKGKYIEIVGNYMPARAPKIVTIDKEKIAYWISKGATPSDSVAVLLKKQGMENMDRYLLPRNHKRTKKGAEAPAKAGQEAAKAPAAAPVAEAAPAA